MEAFYENFAHFTHGMALSAFAMAVLLTYGRRRESRLMRFFFWEMIFWTFIHLKDVDYLIPGVWMGDYLPGIQQSLDMWAVPATVLLFMEIVSPGWATWRRATWMVLPSVLFTAAYIAMPSAELFRANVLYSNVLGVVAMVVVLLASSRHDNFIRRNFSYVEHITLAWMRRVIVLLFVLLLVWSTITSFPTWLNDALYYLFSIVVWGVVWYFTSAHTVIPTPDYTNPFADEPEDESQDGPAGEYPFEARLEQCMLQGKIFLNPKLSITDVAAEVGTNRTYLSDYLNRCRGVTFYEYVNALRIEEACRLMESSPELSAETVAESCGFYSYSTFRRSFVRITGMPPARYRKDRNGN